MENLENKINEMVQKWIDAGWLPVTLPEAYIVGVNIKKLVDVDSSERSVQAPVRNASGVASDEQAIQMLVDFRNKIKESADDWEKSHSECENVPDIKYCEGQETAYRIVWGHVSDLIGKLNKRA